MQKVIMPNGYGAFIRYVPRTEITVMMVDKHGNVRPCYTPPNGIACYRDVTDIDVVLKKIRKFKPVGASSEMYRGPEKWR
jgi:hypothetical protein